MSIQFVNSASGSTQAVAYTATGGNLLVICARMGQAVSNTVITDANNTWVNVINELGNTSGGDQWHVLWYAANCHNGVQTITLPAGFSFWQWVILEYSGVITASPLDVHNVTTIDSGPVTSIQTGSITPSQDDDLIVSFSANDTANSTTQSVDSGLMVRDNSAGNVFVADLIQTAKAAINPTWTETSGALNFWTAGIASFKSAVYSISGALGAAGAGATVTLSGESSATATADGSGNYTFTGLLPGTYLVTPRLTGKAFSPLNRTATIVSINITGVNFTGYTPSKSGSNSTSVMGAGGLFGIGNITDIESPKTPEIGTDFGTEIRK